MSSQFEIHDNGGRPYLVEVDSDYVAVFNNRHNGSHSEDTNEYSDDDLLFRWDYPITVFIGESPETDTTRHGHGYGPEFLGNSILVEIEPYKYVFIGQHISSFETNGVKITEYLSEVGNNDVPYPYATDENGSIYLMIANTILDNMPDVNKKDPYNYYYRHQSRYTETEFNCRSLSENILKERF